jgi:DNA-directed RNA polymerase sigma subunit (sigma70/sigma32)
MIRSLARRIGGSDLAQFGVLWEVMAEAERAATDAITGLRSSGFTWEELGTEIGVSRQAVQQWHKRRLADISDQASTESAVNDSLTAKLRGGEDR